MSRQSTLGSKPEREEETKIGRTGAGQRLRTGSDEAERPEGSSRGSRDVRLES